MRFHPLILLAVLLGATAHAEVTLNVMSYNLRYGNAMDGENAWPKRKDILVRSIKQYDPDILGTQECLDFQAEYLVEQLEGYRRVGIDRDVTGTGESVSILYKHGPLLPVESGNFWLSETPDVPASKSWDTSLTRMATWVRFLHVPTGTFFYFFNTHFDHKGEEARAQSAGVIATRVEALPHALPVIVTGDFNALGGESRPWETFRERGFLDARVTSPEKLGPESTWCGFEAPKPEANKRIDWILYKGPIKANQFETVTYQEEGRYPSDHFAIVSQLVVP
jgi:endonuclease/exonuclease/phosphatase family metal-dependent hydrolase